jgi:hypothetical protein
MGDVVWFGYAPSGCKGTGGVGYLDLSASPPTAALTDADISRPLVGGTAGVLELFARDQSPMNSQTWLVTGGQHQMVAFSPDTGSTGSDIAATPDATEVVLATAGGHQGYDPLTFDPGTTYPTSSPYGASADFGADGSLLATGSSRSLRVFPRGSETPIAEWSVGDAVLDTSLVPGGLAMGGTSRVFALTEASSGVGPRYLVIYTLGSDSPSALALDPVRSGEIGSEVTISGRLLGASVPADQVVSVRRIDPAGSPSAGATVDLGTAPVAADGSFSFGDTPTDAGFTRYVVRWEGRQGGFGASGADPAESAIAVDVRRHPTTLTLDLDAQRYGADELMTATIVHDDDALYPGSVTLYREDPWGDRFEVGSGTMVAGEPLVLQVPPVASGRLVAEYAGSETGDKSRVASDPYTVIPVVRGIVRTAYDVRGDTWFVAPRDTPRVRWRVKPTPFAQCSSLTLQQETRAGWQRLRHSDCVYLLSNGPTTPLKRDHAEGDRWRVRVTVGETPTHESGASPWVYITFRKPPQ